jgi:hypothetical protein
VLTQFYGKSYARRPIAPIFVALVMTHPGQVMRQAPGSLLRMANEL